MGGGEETEYLCGPQSLTYLLSGPLQKSLPRGFIIGCLVSCMCDCVFPKNKRLKLLDERHLSD